MNTLDKFGRHGYFWVKSKADAPTYPHYAVFDFGSIFVPGDERSRSCPGHRYPDSYESTISYIAFKNKETWESYISKNKNVYGVYITPATISEKIIIQIDIKK